MKRLIILFLILKVTLFASIGEITAINGSAFIVRGNSKIPLQTHSKIETKDTIKTMKNSKLQIVFNDKTIISLGQKTIFSINEYLFTKTKVKVNFNISKGLFKSITGKIGKIAPQNFKLHTQNATIGVRGTTIIGETSRDSDNIICSSGKIIVTTELGQVEVNRGEITIVKRGQKPTSAMKVEEKKIIKMDTTIKVINSTNTYSKIITKESNTINQVSITIKDPIQDNIYEEQYNIPNTETVTTINTEVQNIADTISENITQTIPSTTVNTIVQNIADTVSENITQTIPYIQNTIENSPTFVSDATQNLTNIVSESVTQALPIIQKKTGGWGGWNMQTEQEENTEQQPSYSTNISNLQDLVNRVGTKTPTYQGTISNANRFDIFNRISKDDNHINLNFDLGDGTLNGDVRFKTRRDNWEADITNGTVNGNGAFNFDLQNIQNKMQGAGNGNLTGEALEHADGSFNISNDAGKNISANFQAVKQ